MEEVNVEVGVRLRAAREERARLTQLAFAKAVGLSRPSVANIENGRQQISVAQLLRFASVLNVDPCDLLPANQSERPVVGDIATEEELRKALDKVEPAYAAWFKRTSEIL